MRETDGIRCAKVDAREIFGRAVYLLQNQHIPFNGGGYLRARVFLRLRCNRRTRFFFLHSIRVAREIGTDQEG